MEIGSDFWTYEGSLKSNNEDFWNIGKDTKFTFSGRTAIYYVLDEILRNSFVKVVYMPSYVCESMIKPFSDFGLKIKYYDVYFDNGLIYDIDKNEDFDIFFAMNYFGYSKTNMGDFIKYFKQKGKIVVEDITHSLLSKKMYSEHSDYLIGSLRKCFPIISGGIAVNMNDKFKGRLKEPNKSYINIKKSAMDRKKRYIDEMSFVEEYQNDGNEKVKEGIEDSLNSLSVTNSERNNYIFKELGSLYSKMVIENEFININKEEKEIFLEEYKKFNAILEDDYIDYKIDSESLKILMHIDLDKIKKSRIVNAKVIYEELHENDFLQFLIKEYNGEDALMYVPIILDHKYRDYLRNYMIKNEVYLPIHWQIENDISRRELSLICDQRYTEDDIREYIKTMNDFMNSWR